MRLFADLNIQGLEASDQLDSESTNALLNSRSISHYGDNHFSPPHT